MIKLMVISSLPNIPSERNFKKVLPKKRKKRFDDAFARIIQIKSLATRKLIDLLTIMKDEGAEFGISFFFFLEIPYSKMVEQFESVFII